MPIPNGGLITETNAQYYAGSQRFLSDGTGRFVTTFNTDLIFGSSDPGTVEYTLNNFVLYTSPNNTPGSFSAYLLDFTVEDNTIITTVPIPTNTYVAVQLKAMNGGSYGNGEALGATVQENYGGYSYTSLNNVIDGFIATYVGEHKLIPDVKRTDVIFHAKRGLQEFNYDTLKSIKSQEVTITPSLSMIIPQDYVNYVRLSWTDAYGIKHIIYPSDNLTIKPTDVPLQTVNGDFIQDQYGSNTQGTSDTSRNWDNLNQRRLSGGFDAYQNGVENYYGDGYMFGHQQLGMRYGALPETTQVNGYFTMNPARGTISFSSDMNGRTVVLEYISDGLAYDTDSKVPKMAEEAMYMHIAYSILAGRSGVQEYIVQRFKKDRRAQLRNAKIRLSDIKLDQIVRIMRNKSKQIKH